ncbi:MAG: flagellar basal body-associated FliL family protein [Pseudomonadota bacterium]
MNILIPLVLGIVGLGAGLAGGHFLKPSPPEEAAEPEVAAAEATGLEAPKPEAPAEEAEPKEFLDLDRQFVIPIVGRDQVAGLMIVSLALEVEPGEGPAVMDREPKLRDRFLRVMFRHAESGAFSGVFTSTVAMRDLRGALLEAAQDVAGPTVHSVLVTDILRQDL